MKNGIESDFSFYRQTQTSAVTSARCRNVCDTMDVPSIACFSNKPDALVINLAVGAT
jgi:hypothetical protein